MHSGVKVAFVLSLLVMFQGCSSQTAGSPEVVARLFIRFRKFINPHGAGANGHCCDGKFGICEPNGCDHSFIVCVDRTSGINGSLSSCQYQRKISTEIKNQDTIEFGQTFGGVENPIVINLPKVPDDNKVSLKIDIWDEDGRFSKPDYVDTLRTTLEVIPFSTKFNISTGSYWKEVKYRTRLWVDWYTRCAENRYGTACTVKCIPADQCTCDPDTGERSCKNNGTECKTKVIPCESNPCLPGGCINTDNSYKCVCPSGFRVSWYSGNESCIEAPTTVTPTTPATPPPACTCPTLPSFTTTTTLETTTTPRTTTMTNTTTTPNTTITSSITTIPEATTSTPKIEFVNRVNADCDNLRKRYRKSGVYFLRVSHFSTFPAYCSKSARKRGYTVIQRRSTNRLTFKKSWEAYKNGFGNPYTATDFFLGLEKIYWLTNQRRYKLIVKVMSVFSRKFEYAVYNNFRIENEANNYRIRISGFIGTRKAGNALAFHNGAAFSTYDRDNDGDNTVDCAEVSQSGWWFYAGVRNGRRCFTANLNGIYRSSLAPSQNCLSYQCIVWSTLWKNKNYSLVKTEMSILPYGN